MLSVEELMLASSFNRVLTHLTDDVPVSESDYQTILWRVVLVLVLCDEALASVIISFAL